MKKWGFLGFFLLLFWSVTGASNNMVVKQFNCSWYRCPIYFFNTNLLSESVLIWRKMCWILYWLQDTVRTGFYFGSLRFYHPVQCYWKKIFFTLNSIENWDAKPHSWCGIVVDCAMAEFSVIDNEIEPSFSCLRLFCPERQTIARISNVLLYLLPRIHSLKEIYKKKNTNAVAERICCHRLQHWHIVVNFTDRI